MLNKNLRGNPFFKAHTFNPLSWIAALVAALLISLGMGAVPVILANSGDVPMNLTVEQARDLAYANNLELQISYLALEQAELSLQALSESVAGVEGRLGELIAYRQSLEERRDEIQEEIDELESQGDPEGRLPGLNLELQQVQMAILVANTSIEGMNLVLLELENQYRQADLVVQEGRELVELQEKMLGFKVDALFAGCLIVLEQQPLQQSALKQLKMLVTAEQNKQKEGYSTGLEVETAASQQRQLEAAGDELQLKYMELIDYLCLTCGLNPGTALSLVPYEPVQPQPVDLDSAVEQAVTDGWLIQLRRQQLNLQTAMLQLIGESYGSDSIRYEIADLAVLNARLQLQKADGETRAAIRRTYYSLMGKEGVLKRAEADLTLGRLQKQALEAQFTAGYSTPAEAAQAPLALWKKEADLISARYLYHIAYREFELARRGYFIEKEPEF